MNPMEVLFMLFMEAAREAKQLM
ncbi:hypothetical protein WH7805_03342 [Synechococcus sp. WH 7805]|nr:hypothetical protein WH7805_03342 [Synechococcus sp. WH 7805]